MGYLEKSSCEERVLNEDLSRLLLVLFDQRLQSRKREKKRKTDRNILDMPSIYDRLGECLEEKKIQKRKEKIKRDSGRECLHLRHDVIELVLRHSGYIRR